MRIKVDEDLPPAVTQGLREAGHDAVGIVEQGMQLVLARARIDDLTRLVSGVTPRGLRTRRPTPL